MVKVSIYISYDPHINYPHQDLMLATYNEKALQKQSFDGVLKSFANFPKRQFCCSLFLIKVQTWRPATLLTRDSDTVIFL